MDTEEIVKKIESASNNVIPKYIKCEDEKGTTPIALNPDRKMFVPSQEKVPENKVIDILETKENLEKDSKNTLNKPFSKWNLFKHNTDIKIRNIARLNRTIRIMLKADTIIYPIDVLIEGKSVLYRGRRYKLDGYEHRIYELQGLQCIFVDVNDARPLDLSHQYTNPAYDAREFGSLFDSKAIQDLMAGIEDEKKMDKIFYIAIISAALSGLSVAILMGWIKPDWQKMIEGIVNVAQTAAQSIQQQSNGAGSTGQTITGR